jgi:hypothetical protein
MSSKKKSKSKLAALNEAAIVEAGLDDDVELDQNDRTHAHGARAPPDITVLGGQAYGNKHQSARYLGISVWRFIRLVNRRVLPRGFPMTPKGPHHWSFRKLDLAMAKCAASRKPRRQPPLRSQRMGAADGR